MVDYDNIRNGLYSALELQLSTINKSKLGLDICSSLMILEEKMPIQVDKTLHSEVLYLKLLSEDAIQVYSKGFDLVKGIISEIESDKENAEKIFMKNKEFYI